MAEWKGIDVSRWQGTIDWNRVKAAGIQFAMIRISYGMGLDSRFRENLAGAKAAGVPVGVYHFTTAVTPEGARQEIDWLFEQLGDEKLEYPVAFDMEDEGDRYTGMTRGQRTDIAVAGLSQIEQHGYYAILYTNPSWLNTKLDAAALKPYDIWLAAWQAERPAGYDYGMWQYTSAGKVDGIDTNVDLDAAFKNYPAIIKAVGLNGWQTGTNPDYTTYTVKPGDSWWGIAQSQLGDGRKYKELAAFNGATPETVLYAGQVLKIPKGGTAPAPDVLYTVKAGDSLSAIAARFGTTYQALAEYNGIRDPNLIYPGQTIKIPQ